MKYLLLAIQNVLDKVHSALYEWGHVELSLFTKDVVDVKLALHDSHQLASCYSDLRWLVMLVTIVHSTDAPLPRILFVLILVLISPLGAWSIAKLWLLLATKIVLSTISFLSIVLIHEDILSFLFNLMLLLLLLESRDVYFIFIVFNVPNDIGPLRIDPRLVWIA